VAGAGGLVGDAADAPGSRRDDLLAAAGEDVLALMAAAGAEAVAGNAEPFPLPPAERSALQIGI